MRRLLTASLVTLSLALIASSAFAQLQTVQPQRRTTYSATIAALAPAASATDFFTLTGSATKTVWVHAAGCSGISTAAAIANVAALKRSTANLTGTSTAPTAVPYDSTSAAATATVLAYTANPGTLGTLVGIVRGGRLATDAAATGTTAPGAVEWRFGDVWTQPVVLRGIAQVFAINGNAASFAAGASLTCWVEWSE